jgi:hypothetical protein
MKNKSEIRMPKSQLNPKFKTRMGAPAPRPPSAAAAPQLRRMVVLFSASSRKKAMACSFYRARRLDSLVRVSANATSPAWFADACFHYFDFEFVSSFGFQISDFVQLCGKVSASQPTTFLRFP